jgi:hypothetical protein
MLDTGHQSRTSEQLQERKQQHSWISTYLDWKQHPKAQSVKDCHQAWNVYACPTGHETLKTTKSCHFPLCPWCQASRAKRLKEAFTNAAGPSDPRQLRFLVLTVPNSTHLDFRQLRTHVRKLLRTRWWKANITGGCYALETTWSPWFGWHPHANLIVEKREFADLDINVLRRLWLSITTNAHQLFISPLTPDTWDELAKYTVKGSDLIGYPEAVDEYLEQASRMRLASTFGSWWGRPLKDVNQEIAWDKSTIPCAVCHQPAKRLPIRVWIEELTWDGAVYARRVPPTSSPSPPPAPAASMLPGWSILV